MAHQRILTPEDQRARKLMGLRLSDLLHRLRPDLTVAQFANQVGVTKQEISNWRLGLVGIPDERKRRMSEVLGCDIGDFFAAPGVPLLRETGHVIRSMSEMSYVLEHIKQTVLEFIVPKIGFYTLRPQESKRAEIDAAMGGMCGLPPDVTSMEVDHWLKCVHPDDRARIVYARTKSFDPRGNGVFNVEYNCIGVDGVQRRIVDLNRKQFNAAGQVIRHTGFTIDITLQRRNSHESDMVKKFLAEVSGISKVAHLTQ